MDCPACKYPDTRVAKTEAQEFKQKVWRRRECLRCLHRFTTYETPKIATENNKPRKE